MDSNLNVIFKYLLSNSFKGDQDISVVSMSSPTFVDRGVSRGLRGGNLTAVNCNLLDRSRYFSLK
jgi:hypothetical protein